MKFKVMQDNTFLVEFAPEESEIAVAFLKTLSAPDIQQEMLPAELIMLLGGKPDELDYSLMLQ